MANTLTNRGERAANGAPPVAHLVRVLDYDRPCIAGARHSLAGVVDVIVGRGDSDDVDRKPNDLTLAVADARMSEQHARLRHEHGRWTIHDLGSRNGTFVNGERFARAELTNGSIVELGRTAFVLRMLEPGKAQDVTADALASPLPGLRTFSTSFENQLAGLARIALTTRNIVVHGESGTGKEVVARAIHAASRRPGEFVAVNCGALPSELVVSELFGHRKGAFSGATEDRPGLVRSSDKGTLLLDEIGDLPTFAQATLLRVLQERELVPVGGTKPISLDLRVVAASHVDLERAIADGEFREDLWSRLAGHVLELPALRDRREDLGLLIAGLLTRSNLTAVRFSPEVGRLLVQYDWPRNVRELEQTLGSASALTTDGMIELAHLPRAIRDGVRRSEPNATSAADLAKRDALRAALAKHRGNVAAVGRELGVARMQVHRWLERFAIDVSEYRDP